MKNWNLGDEEEDVFDGNGEEGWDGDSVQILKDI